MDRTRITIITAACGALGGGVLFGAPLISSAGDAEQTPTTTVTDDTATTDDTAADRRERLDGEGRDRRDRRGECLRSGRGQHHGPGGRFLERSALAELLDLTPDELRARLRDGETIADIARDNGVDPQTVIDTLVAEAQANLDERAARIDDRLDRRRESLEERVTDLVNGERPALAGRHGRQGRDGNDED